MQSQYRTSAGLVVSLRTVERQSVFSGSSPQVFSLHMVPWRGRVQGNRESTRGICFIKNPVAIKELGGTSASVADGSR